MRGVVSRQFHCVMAVLGAALVGVAVVSPQAVQAQAALAMTYDALGRVTRVTYPGNVVVAFAYDAAGNRSSYTVTGSTNPPPVAPTPVGSMPVVTDTPAAPLPE